MLPNEAEMPLEQFTLAALKDYLEAGFKKFAPTIHTEYWLRLDMGFLRLSIDGNTVDIYSSGKVWRIVGARLATEQVTINKTETFEIIKMLLLYGIENKIESWFEQTYDCAA